MKRINLWLVVICASIFTFAMGRDPATAQTEPAQPEATACQSQNALIVMASNSPAGCLDDSGWHQLSSDSPFNVSNASEVVVCTDKTYLFPNYLHDATSKSEVSTFDGTNVNKLPASPEPTSDIAACAGADSIWMPGATQDVLHFDGSQWTTYTNEDVFGKLPKAPTVSAIAVSPDGKTVWVASENALARFDGSTWQLFKVGKGLQQTYDFSSTKLRFDSTGALIANTPSAWLKFDGKAFKSFAYGNYSYRYALDSKNDIWSDNTYSKGISFFNGKKWTPYPKAYVSSSVHSIVVDGQDRPWVATGWGLSVFDGKAWIVLQMANSDIGDNSVQAVIALGNGPQLPALKPKMPGTVTGQITDGGTPVANITVELCSEYIPTSNFYGATPCQGEPDDMTAKTDKNGNFTIQKVPVANFTAVAVQGKDRVTWNLLWFSFMISHFKQPYLAVREGAATDLGTIDLSS